MIGIIQGGNVVGSGTGAVTGAPGPWSTRNGHVKVDLTNGKLSFDVEGLVLAAGNSIGTRGNIAQIAAVALTPAARRRSIMLA